MKKLRSAYFVVNQSLPSAFAGILHQQNATKYLLLAKTDQQWRKRLSKIDSVRGKMITTSIAIRQL